VNSITLEQLIALNREISALAAAGVPLAEGLVRVAQDFSGPSSDLAKRLAERIEAGQNLGEALDGEGDSLPSSYRAVVRAGLKSGRLTSALEGYAATATRIAELRRVVGLATLYPVFLLVITWTLFLLLHNKILPSFDWLEIGDRFWVAPFRSTLLSGESGLSRAVRFAVPVALIIGSWLWWRRSSSAAESSAIGRVSWLGWIPGIARVRRLSCQAIFAELLGLFVEQQIPLEAALPLASDGSGMKSLSAAMRSAAAELQAGKPLRTSSSAFQALPPLTRLALLSDRGTDVVAGGLHRAAERYSDRAQSLARSIAFYLPIAITTAVGGTAVLVYTFFTLQPYVATLYETIRW